MAQCKQTAQEFIQDVFSPMIAVLSSHDAEVVCQRNNLTFVELIQPFCRLNTEAQIRDSGNMTHPIRSLKITVRDMGQHPPQPTLAKKLMNEAVANALPPASTGPDSNRANIMSVGDYDLQISGSTPWYEAYRDTFHTVAYPSDHEYIRHYLACIFVVSSSHADPMEQFGKLKQQQMQQQHQQPHKLPKWFCPNILHFFVLIHDVCEEQEPKAETVYQTMKNQFGVNNCHLLQINSRKDSPQGGSTESIPDPWSQFLNKKQEFADGEFETSGGTSEGELSFPSKVTEGANSSLTISSTQAMIESAMEVTEEQETEVGADSSAVIDHPLAPAPDVASQGLLEQTDAPMAPAGRDMQNNPLTEKARFTHKRTKSGGHGTCLSLSDHDRLRIFIHEFVVRGLIPWAERTLRNLNDLVVPRKGIHRSIFSGAKKWFVGNKSNPVVAAATEKTNVVYTSEAPEMQMRRLADLAFMFQLYEVAYQTYLACKKDFNNDGAWLHFAGAREMAGLSVYMQGNNSQRQFPQHYMESAISTYLTCGNSVFATRVTMLYTEALKNRGMYEDAAMQFIKMTSEESVCDEDDYFVIKYLSSNKQDSDLRSALLLEQASHCFIRMKQPMVRKYAFHMILAGHRYSKAGQRRHALRSYAQALQVLVYKGKSWSLAEDHINFTLGRQSFNLKQLDNATAAFKHLLTADSKQSPVQQAAFLREYLFVYKQHLSSSPIEGTSLPQLPLPVTDGNATKILTSTPPQTNEQGLIPASSVSFHDDQSDQSTWRKLEELIVVSVQGSIPIGFRPCVQCHTNRTQNQHNPIVVVDEALLVEVSLSNPLRIPLVLSDVKLLWNFVAIDHNSSVIPEKPPPVISNESPDNVKESLSSSVVETESLEEVTLQGSETKKLEVRLLPRETGELHITGLAYNLGTTPQTNPANDEGKQTFVTSISVRGKVNLEVQGPRLNSTKEEKSAKMYGPDRRLDLVIVPHMPRLEVEFSDFPTSLLCGEVRQLTVHFTNTGRLPLHNLRLASTHPHLYTFSNTNIPQADTCGSVYPSALPAEAQEPTTVTPNRIKYAVNLPVGQLDTGQSVSVPMWLIGPPTTGSHNIKFLFYYQSTESNPKLSQRVVRHEANLTVAPSLSLQASAQRASRSNNSNCPNQLTLSLLATNVNTASDDSSVEFSILQVSCASRQWKLSHLSTRTHSDLSVGRGESMLMCLRADRCQESPPEGDVVFTNVTFDQLQIASGETPCCDFYLRSQMTDTFEAVEVEPPKPATIVEDLRPDPKLRLKPLNTSLDSSLTLIVLWKASVGSGGDKQMVTGQHHISLQSLGKSVTQPHIPKISTHEQTTLKIISDEQTDDPALTLTQEVATQLVKYSLNYTQRVQHDFSKNKLCSVAVMVSLHNCSENAVDVDITTSQPSAGQESSKSDDSSTSEGSTPSAVKGVSPSCMFMWGGLVNTHTHVQPAHTQNAQLKALFPGPGIYSLSSSIQVLAAPTDPLAHPRQLQKCPSPYVIVITDTSSS